MPDVLWRRTAQGGSMPLGRVHVLEDRSLRLEHVVPEDAGIYSCEADNAVGSVVATGSLEVHGKNLYINKKNLYLSSFFTAIPVLTIRPSAQTVEAGQEVKFQCLGHGSPPPFVFWSIEGDRSLIFSGSSSERYKAVSTPDGRSSLALVNTTVKDSGTVVVCSAVNEAGSASARTRLTITSKDDRPPPVIIRGPSNQTLPLKSMAVFTCEATGNPIPVISWYKDSVPVLIAERIDITDSGTLQISRLDKSDAGTYTCVASSRIGKATWSGTLKVDNPTNPNINFFRAPEASMLPGPPSRPHVVNQTESSVTISWSRHNKIGSSTLVGYQIEIFGKEPEVTPGWTIVGRRIQATSFTQHLLTPGVAYTFLIRAENSHGLSPPSQLSEPVYVGSETAQSWSNPEVTILSEARASLLSGNVVRLTEAIPVQPTAVKLLWEIDNAQQYVEGLYIYSIPLDTAPDLPRSYSMQTVLHTGGSYGFTVTNLDKFSRYEFFLVPFFKTVEGRPSNSRVVRTAEDGKFRYNPPPPRNETLEDNYVTVNSHN